MKVTELNGKTFEVPTKIVRHNGESHFVLTDQTYVIDNDVKKVDLLWMESDENGNVVDTPYPQLPKRIWRQCPLPTGHDTFDVSALSDDCIKHILGS